MNHNSRLRKQLGNYEFLLFKEGIRQGLGYIEMDMAASHVLVRVSAPRFAMYLEAERVIPLDHCGLNLGTDKCGLVLWDKFDSLRPHILLHWMLSF